MLTRIPLDELRFDSFRRVHGGLQLGIDTSIRVTHLPTGLSEVGQGERSQHKNRAAALTRLEARLLACGWLTDK